MEGIEIRKKSFLILSIGLLLLSVGFQTVRAYEEDYSIEYEYINTKDMAVTKIAMKKEIADNRLLDLNIWEEAKDIIKEKIQETNETPATPAAQEEVPKQVWRFPTEVGVISQYPHYGHAAYDITSPRGTNEWIFPVANGTISGIYTDAAGALVVTVLHEIDGVRYSSQYAHLSSYATGIYVGKPVTVNDTLGRMGSTGYSTGVHLHLAVVDCAMFDPNDTNCSDLNKFFRYANARVNQGYIGLGSQMYVPGSWSSR